MVGMRIFTICLAIIGIIFWKIWIDKYIIYWKYAILPISYLFNALVFSLFVIIEYYAGNLFEHRFFLNEWSNAVTIHGIITFCLASAIMVFGRKIYGIK